MFEIKAEGLDELMKALKEFAPQIQKRVLNGAARRAIRPVMMTAKSNLRALTGPEATGTLAANIITRNNAKEGKRVGGVVMQVGIRGGAEQYANTQKNRARVINRGKRKGLFIPSRVGETYEHGGDLYYFRFLEFGTSKMKARPFLRPALAQNQQRTTAIMVDELKKGIDRTARRLAKR